MDRDYKRFLWVAMMVTGTCVVGHLLLNFDKIEETLLTYSKSTLLFIPAAMVVIKFKLYLPNKTPGKYSMLITVLVFIIASIIAPKISLNIKEYLGVFAFEMSTLFYFLVRKLDKNVRDVDSTQS